MAEKTANLNYEEVINSQQKRISELRKDLSHYNAKLRHLRRRAYENHQDALSAASAAVAASNAATVLQANSSPVDYAYPHANHACGSLAVSHNIARPGAATASQSVSPHSTRRSKNEKSRQQGGSTASSHGNESEKAVGRTRTRESGNDSSQNTRYWTEREHSLFLYATSMFGPRNYAAISQVVGTRTPKQVRTHAQKYQMRLEREAKITQVQASKSTMLNSRKVKRSRNTADNSTTRDPRKEKTTKILNGKTRLSDAMNDDNLITMKANSGMDNMSSYDEFMKMITGTSAGTDVKGPKMFGESDELDLDFFDDIINVEPRGS